MAVTQCVNAVTYDRQAQLVHIPGNHRFHSYTSTRQLHSTDECVRMNALCFNVLLSRLQTSMCHGCAVLATEACLHMLLCEWPRDDECDSEMLQWVWGTHPIT